MSTGHSTTRRSLIGYNSSQSLLWLAGQNAASNEDTDAGAGWLILIGSSLILLEWNDDDHMNSHVNVLDWCLR